MVCPVSAFGFFAEDVGDPYDVLNIRLGNFIVARLHRGVLLIINSFIGQGVGSRFLLLTQTFWLENLVI